MTQNDDILLRPAMLFAFLKALPLILLAITFLLLAWWLSPYFILFSLVVCGFAWYRLLYIRSFQYLITNEYIRLTRGIFFKRIDQLEMFRVKDYIITQSFILQLFKLMYLTLKSTDPENPIIQFQDLEDFKKTILDSITQIVKQSAGPKKWLKSSEVRKMIGISPGKLQAIRESGLLAFTRIGGNIYYDPNDLSQLFEANKVTTNEK